MSTGDSSITLSPTNGVKDSPVPGRQSDAPELGNKGGPTEEPETGDGSGAGSSRGSIKRASLAAEEDVIFI